MIPDHKKEEVRDAADIVEVVSDYVNLKRSGSNYVGLCPFHDEKTPSFNVNPSINIYKCFGCGESGDVFNFVMEMEGIGFMESLRTLADRFGVTLPEEENPEENEQHQLREGIYHALKFAGVYYYRMLKESDEAETARQYLKQRDYTWSTIQDFGIGYAPAGGSDFYQAAMSTGLSEEYLLEAGLIKHSQRGEGFYDTFRGRLMFPIFNPSGRVIAFAGRILTKEKAAKYINSPQTKVYNKSEVVYAANFAKHEIRKHKEAILVEGYTDVITMHQEGIKQVVATSGTSITPQQMKLLHRYGDSVTMVYDADSAGVTAMMRGINIALAEGMDVKLLELPEGEDPDSFVKQFGKESFLELKEEEAANFIEFMVHKSEEQGTWDEPAGRKRTTQQILESIAQIPESMSREIYIQHLNKFVKVGDRTLMEELGKILAEEQRKRQKSLLREQRSSQRSEQPGPPPQPHDLGEEPAREERQQNPAQTSLNTRDNHFEKEIIRLMLVHGKAMIEYIGSLCNDQQIENDQLREFYTDIISRYEAGESVSVDHYANREHPYPQLVGEIALEKHAISERMMEEGGGSIKKDKYPFRTAKGALKALKIHYLNRFMEQVYRKYSEAENDEQKAEINQLIREIGRQRSIIQQTSLDELFPDPEQTGNKKAVGRGVFEYKMKSENES